MKTKLLIFIILTPIVYFFNHRLFLPLNGFLPDILGNLMLLITTLVDGFWVLMIMVLFYPKRTKVYSTSLISFFIAGLIIVTLKEVFSAPRPMWFYPKEIFILGRQLSTNSFPSGHSATAFILARYLMGDTKYPIRFLYFGVGVLGALSRIYIGAHFPLDAWVGGFIGFISYDIILMLKRKLTSPSILRKILEKYKFSFVYGWGVFVCLMYLFFYNEKTEAFIGFLNPTVIMLALFFSYKMLRTLIKNNA